MSFERSIITINKNAGSNTSFFEKNMEICFIIASYLSLICLIMASYMRHGWIWWTILDTVISAPQNRTQGHSVLELSEKQNRKIKLDHNLFLQKWKHTWNIHMISTIFPADHRRCYQIKKLQLIYRQIFQFLVFYIILDGHWITYNIQHTMRYRQWK